MNKSKFLIAIIVILLISNGILFSMFLHAPERHEGPKKIIIEKLGFDQAQIESYEKLIQNHRKEVHENEHKMEALRTELYTQLKNSKQNTTQINQCISDIANQQSVAEKINYRHFMEVKTLCKPEQLPRFDLLTDEISRLFSRKPRK